MTKTCLQGVCALHLGLRATEYALVFTVFLAPNPDSLIFSSFFAQLVPSV